MLEKELAALATSESDSIIYIIDHNTYDLIYLNPRAKKTFQVDDLSTSAHTKCYKVIHNLDAPCDTCQKHKATSARFHHWRHYNDFQQNYFDIRCKQIVVDNASCCLCISDYATHRVQQIQKVNSQLDMANTLIQCIRILDSGQDVQDDINQMLEIVAQYFGGERCYVFEIDYDRQVCNNTYEWVAEGVTASIDYLQDVPLQIIDSWLRIFKERGSFYISDTEELDQDSDTYQILKEQDIHKLIAVPLLENQNIIGFIGIDNPTQNYHDTTLLSSVTHFLLSYLEKREAAEHLKQLSFKDTMTGLYNRNYYNMIQKNMENHPPKQLGIVYLDLNELKYINDTSGHSHGDTLICTAADKIVRVFGENGIRIGGDEFIVLLPDTAQDIFLHKLDTLKSLMQESNIKVSIGFNWQDETISIHKQIAEAEYAMYRDKERFYQNRLNKKS